MEPFLSRRSTIAIILILFLTLVLAFTMSLVEESQDIRQRALEEQTTSVEKPYLKVKPKDKTVNAGEAFSVQIYINTGSTEVNYAKLNLSYDSNVIEAQPGGMVKGDFFKTQSETTFADGVIKGTFEHTKLQSGTGIVTILTFKAKQVLTAQSTDIIFNKGTLKNTTSDKPDKNLTKTLLNGKVTVNPVSNQANTTLSFGQAAVTVIKGNDMNTSIRVDTATNSIETADIEIVFDNSLLEGRSLTRGSFFPNPQELVAPTINNNDGTARIKLKNQTGAKQGSGEIASLNFHARETGLSLIEFGQTTKVTQTDSGENLLKQRNSLIVNVITRSELTSPEPTTPTGGGCLKPTPGTPTNLRATSVDTKRIKLTWNSSQGTLTHYGIVYGPESGYYTWGAADVGITTTFTVGNLSPNTVYYFAVFAVNDCAPSGYSNEANARTNIYTGSPLPTPTPTPSPLPTLTPRPSPTIDPFVPIDPDEDPASQLVPPEDMPLESPEPSVLPKNPLFTPLGGILLLGVSVVVLGIFIYRLRRSS